MSSQAGTTAWNDSNDSFEGLVHNLVYYVCYSQNR